MCVKCGEPSSKGNVLRQVEVPKGRGKGICENDPLERLVEQSEKQKLEKLTKILQNNKATHEPKYIHSTWRTFLNNKTRENELLMIRTTKLVQNILLRKMTVLPLNLRRETFTSRDSASIVRRFVNKMINIPNGIHLNMLGQWTPVF